MNVQAQSHFENSLALFNKGNFKHALTELDQALELAPEQAKYRILRARILLEADRPKQAIQELQSVIEHGDRLAEAFFQLGCVYDFTRDREQAVAQFTQAIQFDPEMVDAYERRGQSNWFLKRYEEAIQDYSIVLRHQPHNGLAYINRGRAYYALAEYLDEAWS